MTEQPKLFGMCEEQLNAYLKAMSQPKLYDMSVEEVKEYLKTQSKPQSSYQPETKKKPEEPPQYFYDISTNLFIG
jgi:hypothetical protein